MSVSESHSFAALPQPGLLIEGRPSAGNPSSWRDMLGVTASIACAIHCAAMPFVISFLPAIGLSFLAEEAFHKWMAGACFLIGLAAFIPGWKRHKRLLPAGIAAAGLSIVTLAAFGLSGECCPTCEASASSGALAADPDSAACPDPGCNQCAADAVSATTATDEDNSDCCQKGGTQDDATTAVAALTASNETPDCCKAAGCVDQAEPSAMIAAADTPACCEQQCAHCEAAEAAEAGEAGEAAAATVPASHAVTGCSDEQCVHCAANGSVSGAALQPAVTEAGFFATYAAWWTPLGGLLMVVGHLFNKRLLCRCACCGTDAGCVTDSANL